MDIVMRALETANPALYVTQAEAYEFFRTNFSLTAPQQELYRRLLLDGPTRGRYIGMQRREEACENDPDRCLERFQHHGRQIATAAARKALAVAELQPGEIGALIVNTCTGYLCPGLSSYVAEDLGLPATVKVQDLMGMGCGAALPNLESAASLLTAGLDRPALSIAVEICTATVIIDDDPSLTVSNCIFGDGAAAAILNRTDRSQRRPLLRFRGFSSALFPQHREALRYRTVDGRLRNVLSKRVPILAATGAVQVVNDLLTRHRLSRADIQWWAVHPGGSMVLDKIDERLGFCGGELRFSREIFEHYGNMSSPTVLFVIKRILETGRPKPGDCGVVLAFGAGFTVFGGLVEFL